MRLVGHQSRCGRCREENISPISEIDRQAHSLVTILTRLSNTNKKTILYVKIITVRMTAEPQTHSRTETFCHLLIFQVTLDQVIGKEMGVYRVLVGKPEGRRPLGRPRCRWVDNIRMDLQEVGCGCMDWIGLAQDRDRWRTLVSAVKNFRVP